MKKGIIVFAILIAFGAAVMVGTGAIAQASGQKVAAEFSIDDPLFKKKKKAPVKFTHETHVKKYKIKCADCHHVFKDGKNVFKEGDKVDKCAACHKSPTKNEGKMLSLKNAFHKNCQGCHKKEKKGPTKCNECHPKKKK
jgi:hypothetical protein